MSIKEFENNLPEQVKVERGVNFDTIMIGKFTDETPCLYEIDFTPKGVKEKVLFRVWSKNSLDAINILILNHIWGKYNEIRLFQDARVLGD